MDKDIKNEIEIGINMENLRGLIDGFDSPSEAVDSTVISKITEIHKQKVRKIKNNHKKENDLQIRKLKEKNIEIQLLIHTVQKLKIEVNESKQLIFKMLEGQKDLEKKNQKLSSIENEHAIYDLKFKISTLNSQLDNYKRMVIETENKNKILMDEDKKSYEKKLEDQSMMFKEEIIEINKNFIIEEQTLTSHTDTVYCIIKLSKFRIASGSGDKSIKIFDLSNQVCNYTLNGHTEGVGWLLKLNDNQIER